MNGGAVYHCPIEGGFTFCEALTDYFLSRGRSVPESLLNGAAPAEYRNEHGKPYFSEPEFDGIFFSRSDTGGYKAVGFSDREIGVDCENTEGRPGIASRYRMIAERFFTEDEQAWLRPEHSGDGSCCVSGSPEGKAPGEHRGDGSCCVPDSPEGEAPGGFGSDTGVDLGPAGRFFEIWTAKEAYMKYTGRGFSEGFRSFSVFCLPEVDIETGRFDGAPNIVFSVCTGRKQ